ncbi:hypothetical protein HanIR_Chr14g0711141 [Helianthus annuus]|nr:hypothetical protein HanIR_Chr14g0711141 [Helianthus annuus]
MSCHYRNEFTSNVLSTCKKDKYYHASHNEFTSNVLSTEMSLHFSVVSMLCISLYIGVSIMNKSSRKYSVSLLLFEFSKQSNQVQKNRVKHVRLSEIKKQNLWYVCSASIAAITINKKAFSSPLSFATAATKGLQQ